jgi:membrane protein implicated in regulation of membrane protease activity
MPPRDDTPTAGEMLSEILDLITGLGILLLPLIIFAVPALILLIPLALPLIPLAILAAPYLLYRWLRSLRRPRSEETSPVSRTGSAGTAIPRTPVGSGGA